MFQRPLPIQTITQATSAWVGSSAGGVLLAATNPGRSFLSLQPLGDALRYSPIGSVTGTSALVASQAIWTAPPGYAGAIWGEPNAGATSAVAIQEFSY